MDKNTFEPHEHALAGRREGGLGSDLVHYAKLLRRRWWLVVGCALVAAAIAWWVQRGTIPRYTAEALLQHRAESVMPLGALPLAKGDDFGTQVEIIRSRAVVASAVDSLGLQLRVRNRPAEWSRLVGRLRADSDPPGGAYALVLSGDSLRLLRLNSRSVLSAVPRGLPVTGPGFTLEVAEPEVARQPIEFTVQDMEVAVERLRGRLRIEQGKGPDLLRIRLTDPDPNLAASIVNTVAAVYQVHRARSSRESAQRRRNVIAEQLVDLTDSLRAVQDLALDYQQRRQIVDPDAEGAALATDRLQTDAELRSLRFQERLLGDLVSRMRSSEGDDESLLEIITMAAEVLPAGQPLHERLQTLQTERSRLTASRFGYTSAEPQVQVLDSLILATRQQLGRAAEQSHRLVRERIAASETRLSQLQRAAGALPEQTAELARLQQRVTAVQGVFDLLVEKYYEAQIAENTEVGDVELVDPAAVPLRPDPSGGRAYIFVALMAGLVVGGMGAVLAEHLDHTVRGAEDVERAISVKVLGSIPRISQGQGEAALVGRESFRSIRTNVRLAFPDPVKLLSIVSAEPGEGKSTVGSNLALAFAEQGRRCLLLDADLRRPTVHRIFGIERSPGLSEVLAGGTPAREAIRPFPMNENLDLLAAGAASRSTTELLDSEAMRRLLDELRRSYDLVVIDTPPLLACSDALPLTVLSDATVVVVRMDRTEHEALADAVAQLREVRASVAGIVLNGAPLDRVRYAGYRSYYSDVTGPASENGDRPGPTSRTESSHRLLPGRRASG